MKGDAMESHEMEVEIGKDGKVRVHIRGAKGKGCIEYARFLEQVIGKIQSQELTAEYYEPDAGVRIEVGQKQRQKRRG